MLDWCLWKAAEHGSTLQKSLPSMGSALQGTTSRPTKNPAEAGFFA